MEETKTTQEIRTLKPNSISFRYAGVGSDIKLYFEDAADLEQQLSELEAKSSSIKAKITAFCGVMTQ